MILLETGFCCRPGGLWSVFMVAGAGAVGLVAGTACLWLGDRMAGLVLALLNVPVLALYGFLAVFFAAGGSR